MCALPTAQSPAMRPIVDRRTATATAFIKRWKELHAQATQVARLAALSTKPLDPPVSMLTRRFSDVSEWQRELAWQGLEDIDAIMQPGVTALKAIAARGQDTNAPALALWREFHAARDAVLAIVADERPREAADAA